jgi:dTDP-glucose 4,6-dehydratase
MTTERTTVVLGANSFSGQDFVDLLLDEPTNRVLGISRSPQRSALFIRHLARTAATNYRYIQIDLNRQMPELLALLDAEQPAWIVNFAAQSEVGPSWIHPEHWFQTNCVALAELVNHLSRRDYLERYLHISSPEVYGSCEGRVTEVAPLNPSTPYAASKAAADLLLKTYYQHLDFPLLSVRATNVYGPGQQLFKIIPRSIINIKLGKTIPLHGGGRAVKSYIHIRDVSRGELAILDRGQTGEVYHLSPERGVAVRDLVQLICSAMGVTFEDVTDAVDERLGQDEAYVIDSARARAELGWAADISLEDGLAEVIESVETNWDEISQLPLEYEHKP